MKNIFHTFSTTIISLLIYSYIWFVAKTSKIKITGFNVFDNLIKANKPFILACWHNSMFILNYIHKNQNFYALVSQSKDGEYITKTMSLFSINSVRGSSSKGGAKALVKLIRIIRKGFPVAITPDGPRGPIYEIQPGIIHLAIKTGAPIIAVSYSCEKFKEFNSWDKHKMPFPFNKISLNYSKPFYIDKHQTVEYSSKLLKDKLNEVGLQAKNFLTT